ncbi:MAG: undecaprenyl-diphosphate phosphatase [Clostridia bacterium]|nr:undecaprenyl-diphosphate phosphatase [Clostridia bacterium]
MTFWEAFFCGLIQGLTEFLPVSSSGHLSLAHTLFGMETEASHLSFDILLHLATLIVVFVVYHRDIFALVPAFFSMPYKLLRGKFRLGILTETERMALLLVLATLPLAGAFFVKDYSEWIAGSFRLVGTLLIANGVLLLLADRFSVMKGKDMLSPKGAIGVGLFQLLATVPGISRSGATISGSMLFGLSRENAVKFSFLMSVPAIIGANIFNLPEALSVSVSVQELRYYLVGMSAALISGFGAIKFLSYISAKQKFGFFAYYCIALGAAVLILR